ncbi:MAG: hypothetical protein NTX45_15300 [Proteobacteria bacterium]|nr:hypothetical protein [Pseudomonadota bacterium]
MNKQTTFSICNRLAGEYSTVEQALIGMGFTHEEAEKLAREYDQKTKKLYLEISRSLLMVQCIKGKFFNYEGVVLNNPDLKAVESFAYVVNRMFEMSGNPNRAVILASIPKSAVQ